MNMCVSVWRCVPFFPQNSTRAHPQEEHQLRSKINQLTYSYFEKVSCSKKKTKSSSTNWMRSVVDNSQNEFTKWHSIIEMNENSPLLKQDLFVMKLLLFEQRKRNRFEFNNCLPDRHIYIYMHMIVYMLDGSHVVMLTNKFALCCVHNRTYVLQIKGCIFYDSA